MGQSARLNGTAGKNFPLWPEEHLRSEHLKGARGWTEGLGEGGQGGVQISARLQCLHTCAAMHSDYAVCSVQCAVQRAAVMKHSGDEENTHLPDTRCTSPTQ